MSARDSNVQERVAGVPPCDPAPPIVEVRDLDAGYGEVVILENVSFSVRRGEIFVVLGTSGCGKSTLLKHLIGLNPPLAGEILIDGQNLATAEADERTAIFRSIGVTYQGNALFGSKSLLENVRLPLEIYTDLPSEAMDLIAWMKLKLVGLEDSAHQLPSAISGGMQKRAAIARALALDPPLLFLDEPSAGFDPVTSAELDALILRLNQTLDVTFVIVSHELASIYASRRQIPSRSAIFRRDDPHEIFGSFAGEAFGTVLGIGLASHCSDVGHEANPAPREC